MSLKQMMPWRWGGLRSWEDEERPFESFYTGMESLHKEMDRLFDDFRSMGMHSMPMGRLQEFSQLTPRIDETEDDKAIHVRVELPGMDQKDVDITLTDGLLTIRGEKKQEDEEKGKDYYRTERVFGTFRRSIPIPVEVDESKIDASFKKGVLKITLPKSAEAQKKVKHIPVKAA